MSTAGEFSPALELFKSTCVKSTVIRGIGSCSGLGVLYLIYRGATGDHQVKFVWRKSHSYA